MIFFVRLVLCCVGVYALEKVGGREREEKRERERERVVFGAGVCVCVCWCMLISFVAFIFIRWCVYICCRGEMD
jgi:hypothetical protein